MDQKLKSGNCPKCGSMHVKMYAVPYHVENLLGMRIGINGGAIKVACYVCKDEVITIPDTKGLVAAAAVARVMLPTKLNGSEIKFLRKATGLSAKDFAKTISVRPETLSRWENNGEQQIGYSEEKIFRILVGNKLKNDPHGESHALAIDYDHMAIVKMVINPIRPSGNTPLLKFERVNLKIENKKPQELWDESESKVA